MIQDIEPHVFHNEFRTEARIENNTPVLCFDGKKVLAKKESDRLIFPKAVQLWNERKSLKADSEESFRFVYAFAVDETEYFLDISGQKAKLEGFEYIDLLGARNGLSNVDGMILFTGTHLHQWYMESRFCGSCAEPTVHSTYERALCCPKCGKNIYPRLMPAVIVGVTDGDKLLVTKYREGTFYALIAGFAEIGETLEQTVAREVFEETGIRVKNIRYYKSQPWGIVKDLLVGFYCDLDGDNTINVDHNELHSAEWKERSDIVLQPNNFSLTNEMLTVFKEGKI